MGQWNSHGENSPTGIYGSTIFSWCEETNRYLRVNQTVMVRKVQEASMGQWNSHGEKSPTGIYGSTILSSREETNRHL